MFICHIPDALAEILTAHSFTKIIPEPPPPEPPAPPGPLFPPPEPLPVFAPAALEFPGPTPFVPPPGPPAPG